MSAPKPHKVPQKHRIDPAKVFIGGRHNHFYAPADYDQKQEEHEVVVDIADVLAVAGFLACVVAIAGVFIWSLYQVGQMALLALEWLRANWQALALGAGTIAVIAGISIWYYLTYTKDEHDKDFV